MSEYDFMVRNGSGLATSVVSLFIAKLTVCVNPFYRYLSI
jgi:hypothetical protein